MLRAHIRIFVFFETYNESCCFTSYLSRFILHALSDNELYFIYDYLEHNYALLIMFLLNNLHSIIAFSLFSSKMPSTIVYVCLLSQINLLMVNGIELLHHFLFCIYFRN